GEPEQTGRHGEVPRHIGTGGQPPVRHHVGDGECRHGDRGQPGALLSADRCHLVQHTATSPQSSHRLILSPHTGPTSRPAPFTGARTPRGADRPWPSFVRTRRQKTWNRPWTCSGSRWARGVQASFASTVGSTSGGRPSDNTELPSTCSTLRCA